MPQNRPPVIRDCLCAAGGDRDALSLSVDFEAESDDEALARAEQIYYGAKPEEFEEGSEAFDFALCDPMTGRTLVD